MRYSLHIRTTSLVRRRTTSRFRPVRTNSKTTTDSSRSIITEVSRHILSRNNILKSVSRKPYLRGTTVRSTDQTIESSNQSFKGITDETTKLTDLASVLQEMQKATVRTRSVSRTLKQVSPTPPATFSIPVIVQQREPRPFEHALRIYVPDVTTKTYDYYDDAVRIVSQLPINSKVLLHGSGNIRCLDQGNFPHPTSCKKFISCAKIDNGDILGWEYRCPKYLSFDPVGGMCNWATTGAGCDE